jgi:hypothetical protein
MKFFTIIRGSENQGVPPEGFLPAMDRFVASSLASGVVVSTGGLAPSMQGARMRIANRKLVVTDGPFTETKEVVGGYAILQGDSREAVFASAREFMQLHLDHWPGWEGECELRELVFLAP